MTEREKIQKLIDDGHRQEAILVLTEFVQLHPEEEEDLLWLGELVYSEGNMTEALNKFNAVLRLNPNNRKARNYVAMIHGILGYYCKDLLNP